jgi:hypothetical protein
VIDRVKLLIGLLSNDDEQDAEDVTVFELMAMLDELRDERRAQSTLPLATT